MAASIGFMQVLARIILINVLFFKILLKNTKKGAYYVNDDNENSLNSNLKELLHFYF